MPDIQIILEKCKRCNTCIQICPMAVFELKDRNSDTKVVQPKVCISCGQCVAFCNQDAINHSIFPPEKISPLNPAIQVTFEQIQELFKGRRSVRNYKDKVVEKDIIEKIIHTAYLAPSAENFQSTEFSVVQNKETISKMSSFTAEFVEGIIAMVKTKESKQPLSEIEKHSLLSMEWLIEKQKEGHDMFLFNAPSVLVFHSVTTVSLPEVSVNLVLQNATMVSHALGAGGFYAGYVTACSQNDNRINEMLNIPKENKIYGIMTIGYPKYKSKNHIIRKTPSIDWK